MTEKNQKIVNLILDKEKTLEVLSKEVGLSQRQVYSRLITLKTMGYSYNREFYYNGEQTFKMEKQLIKTQENDEFVIHTNDEDKEFNAVVISDLHLGSVFEKIDAIEKIYDYCKKEGINIILNGGDLIDGTFGNIKKTYDINEQVKDAVKNHPYDKNILNFICLGDHDASTKIDYGIDFKEYLINKRPDLIPISYGNSIINIKNDHIVLNHPVGYGVKNVNNQNGLVLKGHSHITRIVDSGNSVLMQLPSLSGIAMRPNLAYPSAIRMSLSFNNGIISRGIFNQLLIQSDVMILNELSYDLSRGKTMQNAEKVLTKGSQIEKFNNKYK